MNILNQEVIVELFENNYLLFASFMSVGIFALTYYLIPKILWVSQVLKLNKEINHRSSHALPVPAFGGIAFFLVLILAISLFQSLRTLQTGNHLIIGLTFLFMAGLKDDLVVSSAKLKFLSQLFAAGFLVFSPELQLNNLHGFLGIFEIPAVLGYIIKILFIIAIINAYNLIDGIDGLASIAGIVIFSSYAVVFYFSGSPYFVLVSLTGMAILAAFLRFNFSRGGRKMFMGDGGSLIIGLMIAFLSLKILVMTQAPQMAAEGFYSENRLLFISAVLFLPVFDTLRVIILRLKDGKSPFKADRNHMHHVLLDNGLNHKKSSFLLGGLNMSVIILYLMLSRDLKSVAMSAVMLVLFIVVGIAFDALKKRAKQKEFVAHKPKGIKVERFSDLEKNYAD